MKQFLVFSIVSFFISFTINAQKTQMRGKVMDAQTKEMLPYASISIFSQLLGTNTNENGEFLLSVPNNLLNDSVRISYVGYYSVVVSIKELNSKIVKLVPRFYNLNEISITLHKKQTLIINPFKTKDFYPALESSIYPVIYAIYFSFKQEYDMKILKKVWISISSETATTKFGLRFFEANADGTPGADLLKKHLLLNPPIGFSRVQHT